jgi:hypothetical protein
MVRAGVMRDAHGSLFAPPGLVKGIAALRRLALAEQTNQTHLCLAERLLECE